MKLENLFAITQVTVYDNTQVEFTFRTDIRSVSWMTDTRCGIAIFGAVRFWHTTQVHQTVSRISAYIYRRTALLCVLVLAGCSSGPPECSVEGTVRYLSKPIAEGIIRFVPIDDTQGAGGAAEIHFGKYVVTTPGMCAGNYQVMISAFVETGRTLASDGVNPPIQEKRQILPKKFNVESNLQAVLAGGLNVKEFILE